MDKPILVLYTGTVCMECELVLLVSPEEKMFRVTLFYVFLSCLLDVTCSLLEAPAFIFQLYSTGIQEVVDVIV